MQHSGSSNNISSVLYIKVNGTCSISVIVRIPLSWYGLLVKI